MENDKNKFNGSNCDRKSQFSGILTEPSNLRDCRKTYGKNDNISLLLIKLLFQGYRCESALSSFYEGSLKITQTVPLSSFLFTSKRLFTEQDFFRKVHG